MIATRLVKTAMVASTALFALVVTYNNLVDYGSNYTFVRHTLSMDTTFPDNALKGRAIESPAFWTAAYWLIILTEGAIGVLLALGTARLAFALRERASAFNAAKRIAILGLGLGFLLWFTGFMVVGGEWFTMWQSRLWNGQEPAFRFYATLLLVLIFLNQRDGELDS
jgi:predicted small integral membrane protein